MGSFLMACAVTGATLNEGAEVVAFPMEPEEVSGRGRSDLFNRAWFISDFPVNGVYNDYGNVLLPDGSEVGCEDGEYMLMHKWAWEELVAIVKQDEAKEDARYVEYNRQGRGYTNYRLKRIQEAKDCIDKHIKAKTGDVKAAAKMKDLLKKFHAATTPDEQNAVMDKVMALTYATHSSYNALRWGGEGCNTSDDYWRARILDAENPHEEHDRFREEVLIITKATGYVFFGLRPSMYASQKSNYASMIKLYKRGIAFFEEREAYYNAE